MMNMVRTVLLTLTTLVMTNALGVRATKVPPFLGEVFIEKIINNSDGVFRIYLSDRTIDQVTIMPRETAILKQTVRLTRNNTVWVYPIQGSFETIFMKLGGIASGMCEDLSDTGHVVSYWRSNPSLPLNQRVYKRLCMGLVGNISLTINEDGSIALHTLEVANVDTGA